MMKLNFVTLENGINYMIINEESYNDVKYLYLVNENNNTDFCIRKLAIKDGEHQIISLENDEEFNLALSLFNHK